MQTRYLGPACAGQHRALAHHDVSRYPPTCYLLQACAGAGVRGPVIEGDVLVVDEARVPGHGDLVAVMCDRERELFEAIRLGPRFRYRRIGGSETVRLPADVVVGVVVSLMRRYAG